MAEVPISIKPEREYLHEILKHMDSGSYAIPLFQRNYVWDKKQILDLFDSISKGYPIGSILLWRPKNRDSYNVSKEIVTDDIISNSNIDYFILDGRQRLTSFYGCLYGKGDMDERFRLFYNLETESFEYPNPHTAPIHVVSVADIFDTFKLLDRLQEIQSKVSNPSKAVEYITRAKKMNSIFQGYQIGELLFENYTLDEAGTVFARVNSKGTDISKVSMLQALFYKEDRSVLFSKWVEETKTKLGKWGFEKIREEDILNCCYRYSNLNFYDHDLMEKVDKLDFINKLDEIREDLMREAAFLHNECGVVSASMLPYAKQWVILAGAFKEKKQLSSAEKQELRRWLYYTTVRQTFMNSSLSVVRAQARRFEKFLSGECATAADYVPVEIPPLTFYFQLTSALSCLLMIAMAVNYKRITGRTGSYCGEYRALGGKNPVGVIPFFSDMAKLTVYDIMDGAVEADRDTLESLVLSKEMLDAWQTFDVLKFEALRRGRLYELERNLLESEGVKCLNI